VTAVYAHEWYLGYVIEKEQNLMQANVTFLEPKGPSRSFVDILTPAEVSISNEKSYNLIKEEQVKAS
jgi:hypothetical protein